ncbi:MAG: glycosyltransferase, partial [Bacteroidota bacterium]
ELAVDHGFKILEKRFEKQQFAEDFMARLQTLSNNLEQHRKTHFTGQILKHQHLQATRYLSKWIEEKNRD